MGMKDSWVKILESLEYGARSVRELKHDADISNTTAYNETKVLDRKGWIEEVDGYISSECREVKAYRLTDSGVSILEAVVKGDNNE